MPMSLFLPAILPANVSSHFKQPRLRMACALALATTLMACQSTPLKQTVPADVTPAVQAPNSTDKPSELAIDMSGRHEYQLENGLKIIVKEDHRAPVVMTQIWYRVGSADEPLNKGGISHLLEHMMHQPIA